MSITDTHTITKSSTGVMFFVLYFIFFAPLCLLTAQSGSSTRFVQRLTWEPDPAASLYEVIVEQLDRNRGEVLRETSAEAFLDCSLLPGQYRYQVRVYDLFGRVGVTSDWAFFEVIQPRGNAVQRLNWESEGAAYYEIVIEQQGSSGQYYELARKVTEEPFIDSSFPIGRYRYQVTAHDIFGNEADSDWAYFEVDFSLPDVVAVPSAPVSEPLLVLPEPELPPEPEPPPSPEPEPEAPEPPEPPPPPEPVPPLPQTAMDILIQAAYSPLITLPSGFFDDPSTLLFVPIGASFKLQFIPFKAGTRGFGFGLASSWHSSDFVDHSLHTHLGLVFRQWLPNHIMAFSFWLGGGLSLGYQDSSTWLSSVSSGMSFQWFITRPFFVTLGLDVSYILSNDSSLYVHPSLGFGWQF